MIEDVRQIFQDFLAPELRAITARLDGIDKRFKAAEKIADARHNETMTRFEMVQEQIRDVDLRSQARDREIEKSISALQETFQVSRRLERLEALASKSGAAERSPCPALRSAAGMRVYSDSACSTVAAMGMRESTRVSFRSSSTRSFTPDRMSLCPRF